MKLKMGLSFDKRPGHRAGSRPDAVPPDKGGGEGPHLQLPLLPAENSEGSRTLWILDLPL